MAKKIVFSFDDGRLDTYSNAYKILSSYQMTCTINVTSEFVYSPEKYSHWKSASQQSMTVSQILECQENGVEIACHGHKHKNSKEDVLQNIFELQNMGVNVEKIGFASPNSAVYEGSDCTVKELFDEGKISYIRSGIVLRREGIFRAGLAVANRFLKSKKIFCHLNKKNIFSGKKTIIPSVSITNKTTVGQIKALCSMMKDGENLVLMFHSVLEKTDNGYGLDGWYFDKAKFIELCEYFYNNQDFNICTMKTIVNE